MSSSNPAYGLRNFVIPGLMPQGAPLQESRVFADADGGLILDVLTTPVTDPEATLKFHLLDEERKIQYYCYDGSQHSTRESSGTRVYQIRVPGQSIGVGCSLLACYLGDRLVSTFYVTREAGAGSWVKSFSYLRQDPQNSGASLVLPPELTDDLRVN
jgi:hypothetical protein